MVMMRYESVALGSFDPDNPTMLMCRVSRILDRDKRAR